MVRPRVLREPVLGTKLEATDLILTRSSTLRPRGEILQLMLRLPGESQDLHQGVQSQEALPKGPLETFGAEQEACIVVKNGN